MPEGESFVKLKEVEYGTGTKVKTDFISVMCQHCEDPACAKVAPEGAVYRHNGAVIFDPEKSKGARRMVHACPYRAVSWNEELGIPQKCTLCAHMTDEGERVTRCTENCPTGALIFGDLDDPDSRISREYASHKGELETYHPEFGLHTTVKYRNLPRPFIAGELICGDTDAVCAGATVTIEGVSAADFHETKSDFLGDFEVKRLETNALYKLTVNASGYRPLEMEIRLNAAKDLGELILEKV
jgi:Fe-S-cluster-containing dehydrogenase component